MFGEGIRPRYYAQRMQPTPTEPISVLIADDQRLVRTGFRVILASEPGIEVVGEAADGIEAVELARSRQPDVVLMDIRMPEMDVLRLIARGLSNRDRRRAGDRGEHRQDPRRPGTDQARAARPGPGRRPGLRDRASDRGPARREERAIKKGEQLLLSTFNLYRTGGLAARPGSCRRMAGRGRNLRNGDREMRVSTYEVEPVLGASDLSSELMA
jgi:hypothetical protein